MKTNPIKQAIVRACSEKEFRARLIADPRMALAEEGLDVPADVKILVHEATDSEILVVLPSTQPIDLQQHAIDLPSGPVANVPAGLTLEWRDNMLVAVGKIDSTTAPAVQRELLKAFQDIEIDMAEVTFLSSAGLSALLAGYKHLAAHDAKLYLVDVTEEVRNVLELVGFLDMLEVIERTPAVMNPYAGLYFF